MTGEKTESMYLKLPLCKTNTRASDGTRLLDSKMTGQFGNIWGLLPAGMEIDRLILETSLMLLCKSVYSYIPGLNPRKCVLMCIASNRHSMFLAREKNGSWKNVKVRQ